MATKRILNFLLIIMLALLLVLPLPLNSSPVAFGAPGGLPNAGFEEGLLDGAPKDWTVVSAPDAVKVVDAEGPLEFPTYTDMGNVTVSPFKGNRMLRLGTPKRISESQVRGLNIVSQTFTSDRNNLRFSLRLFSWEPRSMDQVGFDLQRLNVNSGKWVSTGDPLATPLVIKRQDGSTMATCSILPCQFAIDTGKQGDFLDTKWMQVEITNLGQYIGQSLTLIYSVGGTNNTAHATWAYFDNVNTPPVAKFSFIPGNPQEGSAILLKDLSYDPDGAEDIVSWRWTIQGLSIGVINSSSQNPSFIPPDDGTYSVSLTVTDTNGESNTVSTGGMAADGSPVSALVVADAPPLVNALDIEVLPGQDVRLFGRFLDPGWPDTHTAVWVFDLDRNGEADLKIDASLQEDHVPALGTGIVSGIISSSALTNAGVTAGVSLTGLLRVTDDEGNYRDDLFKVTVVVDNPSRFEPNDNLAQLGADDVLLSDSIYLSYTQSRGDIDLFEVKWPGTDGVGSQPLPAGTEVLVTLKGLPADYDLAVLTQIAPGTAPFQLSPFQLSPFQLSPFQLSPFQLSPFQLSAFQRSPFQLSPFQLSPFQLSPFQLSPFQLSPFQLSPFQLSPFQLSPFQLSPFQISPFQLSPFQLSPFQLSPLSQMGFTGIEGTEISGTDIGLAELALGSILTDGLEVAGFSANRGLEEEGVLVRVDVPGTRVFAVVLGVNEAHSFQPYSLQIETSMPLDAAVLSAELTPELEAELAQLCSGSPLVQPATTGVETLYSVSSPQSLVVTQKERLVARYDMDAAAWTAFQNKLEALAQHSAVGGKVISLPSNIYDTWDSSPCSVDAANVVTDQIRGHIMSELSNNSAIRYIVIVGSDEIVPFRRVPDETVISNERYYLFSAFLRPGSPLFSSVQQGYNLTDDFYVDLAPSPWQGRALYVPDLSLGRLVETPQEISAVVQAFLDSNGQLDPSTAFVSGYDFFTDGSLAMAGELSNKIANTRILIDDSWSAADLRCYLLGQGTGVPACASAQINAVNAHFTHYAALSAGGFNGLNNLNVNDFLTSVEVAAAQVSNQPALARAIVFSMGCHAGLNVPDKSSAAADPGLGINPALDFVQALSRQRAISVVASTGYGLGDDEGIGGTERLLVLFAQELAKGDTTGHALMVAKQRYLSSLSAMTVYDEKSSIQTTLYGLPQYMVLDPPGPNGTPPSGTPVSSLTLNLVSGPVVPPLTLYRGDTADGSYFTADGDAQATAGRPIQPRFVMDLPAGANGAVHSALLTGGNYTDYSNFDPVITRPTTEWETNPPEPQTCLPSFWPSELATINSLETSGGLLQTLVLLPGQFRCTSGLAPIVTGTQRLYTNLTFELLRSSMNDWEPPLVHSVDLRTVGEATVAITVEASDPGSGIARIVVLRIGAGTITSNSLTVSPPQNSGRFTISVPAPTEGQALVVQVVDGAGNVASATGKGANLKAIKVDAGIDQAFAPGVPTTFRATVYNFVRLTPPVSFLWDFGDGTFQSGLLAPSELATLPVKVDANGNATFTVTHQYSQPSTAILKVTDASGGIGVDDVAIVRCADAIDAVKPDGDLIACSIDNDATTMTITLWVDGLITDEFQYRVGLDVGTSTVDANGNKVITFGQPDGVADLKLRYDGAKITGLSSLQVVKEGNQLKFIFNLADIGRAGDGVVLPVLWFAETQAGIKATEEVGIADKMPDSSLFGYVLR